ncbi:hypothetical protein FBR04_14665 [Betaproteobacteria bacterium PRO7]|jgi:hypothetical protein|nr:hypothetical protein [Betaproteobacteria bacterium PRO7]
MRGVDTPEVRLTRHERRELSRAAWLLVRGGFDAERRRLIERFLRERAAGVGVTKFVCDLLTNEGKSAAGR